MDCFFIAFCVWFLIDWFFSFKFKDFILDDYLEDMQNIAKKYFNVLSFSYEYIELQNKLLTDKRTHRGISL